MSIGYASWVIGSDNDNTVEIDVDVDEIEEVATSLFGINSSRCTSLQYYLAGDSSAGGLIYDGIIGNTGTISFYLNFNMSSFREKFSWSKIDFQFTLSYASSITTLTLLNSSTVASLKTATTTGSLTQALKDDSITQVSADDSSIIYKTSKTVNSSDSYNALNFYITYEFTVSNGLNEAKALAALKSSTSIFKIKAKASQGSD